MATMHWLTTLVVFYGLLAGATVFLGRWVGFPLARVLGIAIFVLTVFVIEHVAGLGDLRGLWPPLLGLALYGLWQRRQILYRREFIVSEIVFLVGVISALLWRGLDPDIDPDSGRLSDLFAVNRHLMGLRLRWMNLTLAELPLYATALLARVFALPAGTAMNLAPCLALGLASSLIWSVVAKAGAPRWGFAAILIAFFALAIELPDSPNVSHRKLWSGDGWLRQDPAHAQMLDILHDLPRGIVIEGSTVMAPFAGQPSYPQDDARRWIAGKITDPLGWLRQQRVDYILWSRQDIEQFGDRFDALAEHLQPDFEFHPIEYVGAQAIGIWQRRAATDESAEP